MTDAPGSDPTEAAGDTAPPSAPEPEQVMDLLAEHVPLALLMDLVTPDGPPSAEILQTEGMPDDAWWEPEAPGHADGAAGEPPA